MAIPNINKIAKDVIPECIVEIKKNLRKTVLTMMGFTINWTDIKIDDRSPLFQEIKEFEEYKELKKQIMNELRDVMKTPISIKDKNSSLSEIKKQIMWKIECEVRNELVDEYTKQAMDIIRMDPSIAPTLIAANFIKHNTKK